VLPRNPFRSPCYASLRKSSVSEENRRRNNRDTARARYTLIIPFIREKIFTATKSSCPTSAGIILSRVYTAKYKVFSGAIKERKRMNKRGGRRKDLPRTLLSLLAISFRVHVILSLEYPTSLDTLAVFVAFHVTLCSAFRAGRRARRSLCRGRISR
jgi:hypothetical protein